LIFSASSRLRRRFQRFDFQRRPKTAELCISTGQAQGSNLGLRNDQASVQSLADLPQFDFTGDELCADGRGLVRPGNSPPKDWRARWTACLRRVRRKRISRPRKRTGLRQRRK